METCAVEVAEREHPFSKSNSLGRKTRSYTAS
jgi:hypothetical protein